MQDFSIVDQFKTCTSKLRVKIHGNAISAAVAQARADCRTKNGSCRVGVEEFKIGDGPRQSGLSFMTMSGAGPATCYLCDPVRDV